MSHKPWVRWLGRIGLAGVVALGVGSAVAGAYPLTLLMFLLAVSVPVAGWVARRETETGNKAPPGGVPRDTGHFGGGGF